MTDDRGAKRDRMRLMNLAKKLGGAIEITGVSRIVLGVTALGSRKDAIRADVDKACADKTTKGGQTMREQSVDRDHQPGIASENRVLGYGYAVDNHFRLNLAEDPHQLVLIFDIAPDH